MSVQKTFLVTLSARHPLDQHLLDSAIEVQDFSGIEVVSVTEFSESNYERYGKIQAIKEVRTILGVGLRDAKHLVDTAQEKGEMRWSHITITHKGDQIFCIKR